MHYNPYECICLMNAGVHRKNSQKCLDHECPFPPVLPLPQLPPPVSLQMSFSMLLKDVSVIHRAWHKASSGKTGCTMCQNIKVLLCPTCTLKLMPLKDPQAQSVSTKHVTYFAVYQVCACNLQWRQWTTNKGKVNQPIALLFKVAECCS